MDTQKQWDGISEVALYLFGTGANCRAYEILGAHPYKKDGKSGFRFSVWAPHADAVYVAGSFNNWDAGQYPMEKIGTTGVFYTFVEGVQPGELYKFVITDSSGQAHYKADPYAFASGLRPGTASVTCADSSFVWHDAKWETKKKKQRPYDRPMLIYEVHIGSWRRGENGELLSYREVADQLVPYVKEMGFTHIELMPIAEYPFDASWGYQVTGYYSPTSRYGSPDDFRYFVDLCHKNGIAVILDWVAAHFPRDAHGLRRFDGTPLYEYADPRLGEHSQWGTLVFDYAKSEVISFLISNAYFWLREYHIDGLRVDAVSSMLYRDYGRSDGEWLPNKYGGKENLEAVAFLRSLNTTIFADYPNALMIAEESTAWPKITRPVDEDGLGFNYKWNMGWMNDTLRYMELDPYFRKYNHSILTFLLMYAFSENYILPLSHDEVVHGKRSLIDKMFGSYEEKFAQLRLYYAYMYAHPGKKLLFMGGEFGQFIEWREDEQLDWMLLDYDSHRTLLEYVKHLNHFYLQEKSLWQIEDSWDGFRWINASDEDNSVISFLRYGRSRSAMLVVVCNFTPVARDSYRIGVPSGGMYRIVLSSSDRRFGGSGTCGVPMRARKKACDGFKFSLEIDLPPLTTLYLKREKRAKAKDEAKK